MLKQSDDQNNLKEWEEAIVRIEKRVWDGLFKRLSKKGWLLKPPSGPNQHGPE